MYAAAALWLTSTVAVFTTPTSIGDALTSLPGGDLVFVQNLQTTKLAKTVVAIRVMAPVDQVRALLSVPATFQAAIPTFRRIEVVQSTTNESEKELAWELEIPLWNLHGQLRWRAHPEGVELTLHQGDLAPGQFRISAHGESTNRTLLLLESTANVKDANWMVKRIVRRLPLGESAIATAASYVLLKALALYLEHGRYHRSNATMAPASLTSLNTPALARYAPTLVHGKTMVAVVLNRTDGRLNRVEAAFPIATKPEKIEAQIPTIAMFRALPGWKETIPEKNKLSECRDPQAHCYVVDSSLPFFDMDAIWKVWGYWFRARAIAETLSGAVMALDAIPHGSGAFLLLSQSMGLHKSGYVARKLIAGEPLLEQGLALARILVDTVSLAQALDERKD
jgi:hypothetical protein